jgi:predicted phage tail component-like protein
VKYNSGHRYNTRIPDGGALYNSGPYLLIVSDGGTGTENLAVSPTILVDEPATGNETVAASVTLAISDIGTGDDGLGGFTPMAVVEEVGMASETIVKNNNVFVNEYMTGIDNVSVVAADLLVTEDMILYPFNVHVLRDSIRPLFPTMKYNVIRVPGRRDDLDFGTKYGYRLFEFRVASDEFENRADLENFKRQLSAALDPEGGYRNLVFNHELDRFYRVRYVGRVDLRQYPTFIDISIPLRTDGPFAYSIDVFLHAQATPSTTVANNDSSVNVQPLITFTGPQISPRLVNTTMGLDMMFDVTLESGELLVVDAKKRTARKGTADVLTKMTGDFLRLAPGPNSLTSYGAYSIAWRGLYL